MKATHNGTCQICGRVQAVTSRGLIAKHGYTVNWGFFHGTCPGSDNKPFEQSNELLGRVIKDQQARVEDLLKRAVALKDTKVSGDSTTLYRSKTDSWVPAKVVSVTPVSPAKVEVVFSVPGEDKPVSQFWYGVKNVSAAVFFCNLKFADHLETVARHTQVWLASALERFNSWAPAELLPRDYVAPAVEQARAVSARKAELRRQLESLKDAVRELDERISPMVLIVRDELREAMPQAVEDLYYHHTNLATVKSLRRRYDAAVAAWPPLARLRPTVEAIESTAAQAATVKAELNQ